MKYINIDYHPADSRMRIASDDICQSLTSRMGTGGNNVPVVLVIYEDTFQQSQERSVGRVGSGDGCDSKVWNRWQ